MAVRAFEPQYMPIGILTAALQELTWAGFPLERCWPLGSWGNGIGAGLPLEVWR